MKKWAWILFVVGLVVVAGCAAGPESKWSAADAPAAGFWAGLWHGILLVVALVVSFFTNDVRIYEVNNTGLAYDIGYVLGILAVYGSGYHVTVRRKRPSKKKKESDLGERIEKEIKIRVERMLEDEDDWKELGEKIERKVKSKIRRWLDDEDEGPGAEPTEE